MGGAFASASWFGVLLSSGEGFEALGLEFAVEGWEFFAEGAFEVCELLVELGGEGDE